MIFKNRRFARFAEKERIEDASLVAAVRRAEAGLIDADLGGGLIKQRIARPNEGRSGGFRTIIVFRREEKAFFVYGFAKNERENLSIEDLRALRRLAIELFAYGEAELRQALESGALQVVREEQ